MTALPEAPMALFACALLRDHAGRILLVQYTSDPALASGSSDGSGVWWLPGAQVHLADGGATQAVRMFLVDVLGITRPRLGGMNLTTSPPSTGEPGGKLVALFDCGVIDAGHQFDQAHLDTLGIRAAAWVTLGCIAPLLPPDEHAALTDALRHRPSGYYRHVNYAVDASVVPPAPDVLPAAVKQSSPDRIMPGIALPTESASGLPRRIPGRVPGPANLPSASLPPGTWFTSTTSPE